jgi:pyrroloquinoline quinone biosynthesis protein D
MSEIRLNDCRSASQPVMPPGVRLSIDKLTRDDVLLFPEGMLRLNRTSAAILRLCDGQRTIGKIVEQLSVEFQAPGETIQSDVLEFLRLLNERSLLRMVDGGHL